MPQITTVPITWTHWACDLCSVTYKRKEDMCRICKQPRSANAIAFKKMEVFNLKRVGTFRDDTDVSYERPRWGWR